MHGPDVGPNTDGEGAYSKGGLSGDMKATGENYDLGGGGREGWVCDRGGGVREGVVEESGTGVIQEPYLGSNGLRGG
ncbi:hypothetical protein GW17_00037776 [Ensete ventricosum]|nr:hypothetical protein GW17_00037776 [Ensete ventricosum]RZS07942.1 hypothetical protein BHM03_00038855 [Ensete ventricosum]